MGLDYRSGTDDDWSAAKSDANMSDAMSDWFDQSEGDDIADNAKTVRLSDDEVAELELVIRFWNESNEIRGKKRKKWKDQTVLRKAVQTYLSLFWNHVAQGRPGTAKERAQVIEEFLEGLRQEAKQEP